MMETMANRKGVARPVLYITTAFMVFITVYTLGLRIDLFTTAFDMLTEKFGFLYWYGIQVAGCGLIGLILVAVSRKTLKRMDILLLALLLVWLAVSAVMNRDLGFKENLSGVITIAVTVVAFYLVGRYFSKEDLSFCLTRVILWGTVIWNSGCVMSLARFVTNYRGYYQFGGFNRRSRQGIMDGRLFGCFSDPNYAALISLLLVGGLIFVYLYHSRLFGKGEKRPLWLIGERLLVYISITLNVLYFVLSGSRSGDVAALFTMVVLIVFITYRRRKFSLQAAGDEEEKVAGAYNRVINKIAPINGNLIRAYGARLLMGFIVFFVIYFGVLFGVQAVGQIVVPERDVETELERDDVTSENISNSRFRIWTDYAELVKDRPIFGLSTRGALKYAEQKDPESYLVDRQYNPHSMFVQMLVQGGVVGLLLMLAFFLRVLIRTWKRCRNRAPITDLFILSIFWVLIHCVFCVFNVGIFITPCFEAMLVWIGLGYLETSCEEVKEGVDVGE